MGEKFIYLLVDPEGGNEMYVGLTTYGFGRFLRHLSDAQGFRKKGDPEAKNLARCDVWIRSLMSRGLLPQHIVLMEADSLKQLQVLEVVIIQVLTAMEEELLNRSAGGESGKSANPYRDAPYPDENMRTLRDDIKKLIPAPTQRFKDLYATLKRLASVGSSSNTELIKLRVLLAKEWLFDQPGELLYLVKDLEAATVPTEKAVPKRGTKRVCSSDGCSKPHHGNGLCRQHDDLRRRLKKKKAELVSKESTDDSSDNRPQTAQAGRILSTEPSGGRSGEAVDRIYCGAET